jgi:hypothetical protein
MPLALAFADCGTVKILSRITWWLYAIACVLEGIPTLSFAAHTASLLAFVNTRTHLQLSVAEGHSISAR